MKVIRILYSLQAEYPLVTIRADIFFPAFYSEYISSLYKIRELFSSFLGKLRNLLHNKVALLNSRIRSKLGILSKH